ncbi:MAG TPA: carbohydrate-binding family 9-like protein [Polyangiaceae bacterium]|nr:carbohydrate-binding family 9-like protein [Polyangiaceae bacterium]
MRSALAVVALLLAACSKAPPPGFEKLELPAAPSAVEMPISLGYVFGDAVELLGAKVTPRQGLRSGARVDVTLFWRKRGSVPGGFRLFTHLLDGAGERILTLDIGEGLRRSRGGVTTYPPSAWREGKVYVDSFSFSVPHAVRTDSLSLVCGLFRERERLPITSRAPGAPPPLRNERALVAKLGVTLPPTTTPANVPNLWVPRRRGEIVIDGKLDDAGWQRSASTGSFVNVANGEASSADEVGANAKLTYDDQALYLGFEVFDEDLRGGFDPAQSDPHLWTKDTVEIMIDPDGDGDNLDYYEIQVGPQNLVFDSQFDAYNAPHGEPDGPFGHQEWSAKLSSAVTLRGSLDDAREDEGYVVELSIPWSSFGKAKRVPPAIDDVWRMNFYAMQNNGGSAWSPILGQGNFHKASRFGRVHFAPPISAIR